MKKNILLCALIGAMCAVAGEGATDWTFVNLHTITQKPFALSPSKRDFRKPVARQRDSSFDKLRTNGEICQSPVTDLYGVARGQLYVLMTGFRPNGFAGDPESVSETAPRKKPLLAAAMSAVVPGAGEFYAGSWIKGAVFLAIEVAAWVGYKHYTDGGNRLRTQFRAYADQYWDYQRWEEKYIPNTDPGSHGLPMDNGQIVKTQQYYEMIGKYDQFMMGWEDWVRGGPDLTVRRNAYESMRHDHNDQLINASRCTMAALTNHLLSAMDAAWTVHRRNRSVRAALGTDVLMARSEAVPVMCLRVAWK
jgi:hypothetical protein